MTEAGGPRLSTQRDLYRAARDRLAAAGVSTPELDARILVSAALGMSAQDLILGAAIPLGEPEAEAARRLVARRLAGEPVDRILGSRDFWGLPFELAAQTLSPRPDSETIVEAALVACPDPSRPLRILDLGTGSGALLVAVLHERPLAFGVGVDRSHGAATTARANAERNGVGERAAFCVGDWGDALAGTFDLVLSNPPYIASEDLAALQPEVRDHDPPLALDGGSDGLAAYRAVLPASARLLTAGGTCVVELGEGQESDVSRLAGQAGLTLDGPARRDLGGVARALVARKA
jgi:release factor glutamine methyltransferase